MTITVDGRPVAVLGPVTRRPRWLARDEFVRRVVRAQADAGLLRQLRDLAPGTTDEFAADVTRGLADTTVFIARESGRPVAEDVLPDELAVSVITIGELRAGVLAAVDIDLRDRRLRTLTAALSLEPIPVDESVAEAWAKLRLLLRDGGQRMPVNDSWIAATAIALGIPVVTQDEDYVALKGLGVIHV